MALLSNVLRTCGLLYCLILYVYALDEYKLEPWINSLKVESKTCVENKCKYLLTLDGGEFLGHSSWRLTPAEGHRGDSCVSISPNYELHEIETKQIISKIQVSVPDQEGKVYFCLYHNNKEHSPFGGKWVHQGENLFLSPKTDGVTEVLSHLTQTYDSQEHEPSRSNLQEAKTEWADLSHDTDINFLPNVTRPTREEMRDIEVLINDKYVTLTDLNDLDDKAKNKELVLDINGNHGLKDTISDDFRSENRIDFYKEAEINRFKREILTNVAFDIKNNATSSPSNKKTILSPHDLTTVAVDTKNDETTVVSDILLSSQRIKDAKNHEQNSIKIVNKEENPDALIAIRKQRQVTVADDYLDYTNVRVYPSAVQIEGLRVEGSNKDPKLTEEGVPSVLADATVTLRLFGDGLTPRTVIAFTHDALEYRQPCKFLLKGEYMAIKDSILSKSALFEIKAPPPLKQPKLYICAKNLRPGVTDPLKDEDKYLHQGTESFKTLETHDPLLPVWVSLCLILICLTFSALFSGLNLGLMSLDRTELKIIANTGTEQERKYARAIMPVRDHGNYLLCSILLGNVAVNSTFTILLDELTSGLFAVIFSTLAIVLLGEITPQAICSRHGLMIGAKSIMITKAVMGLTAPLAYPVSKLLDYFLGEEIGSVYNRERLKELVKVTTDMNDLDRDEVNIISGTLELRKKTVSDVMTKLDDVFMLPITSVLDFETMSEIIKSGYSRIPVYEGNRGNIVTVLFIKDLAFVDPDDNTPLQTLCQYYQNACNFVFEDVTLDVMFKQFKDGHKGHMAFVHRINNEGEGDPFYETIGLVTLEDVIEEMIQAEIVDETDVFMDNRTKRRRKQPSNKLQDFTAFAERHENQHIHISPQLTLATFQFLNTSVDAFRPDTISETVLRRLLRQDVIHYIKLKGKTKKDPSTYVFQQGKPVDYFVLILEGRVEVTVGRENLVFEAGPFTYFGVQALTQNVGVAESPTPSAMGSLQNINMDSMLRHTFVPDYSVRATTELYYLTVKRSLYLAAKRATLMEKGALSKGATNEQFDTEVDKHLSNSSSTNIPASFLPKKLIGKSCISIRNKELDNFESTAATNKLLQSVDEDLSITGEHKTPSRQISPNPPLPVSASPLTRASFTAQSLPQSPPESRNGTLYSGARPEEQEKLLK